MVIPSIIRNDKRNFGSRIFVKNFIFEVLWVFRAEKRVFLLFVGA